MKLQHLPVYVCFILCACNGTGMNDKINHAGQKAGEAVSEMAKGVSQGVKKSFGIQITRADSSTADAIDLGKIILKSKDGTDNMLSVYIIFKKDFNRKILLRVLDSKGLEMGRCSQLVKGRKDEAGYVDFIFDKRTDIDNDSKIIME